MKSQVPEAEGQSSSEAAACQAFILVAGPVPTHLLFPFTPPVQQKNKPKGDLVTGLLDRPTAAFGKAGGSARKRWPMAISETPPFPGNLPL